MACPALSRCSVNSALSILNRQARLTSTFTGHWFPTEAMPGGGDVTGNKATRNPA